jgi:hypothetical protein
MCGVRRAEKNNEGMALKIWAERRQRFGFIYVLFFRYSLI